MSEEGLAAIEAGYARASTRAEYIEVRNAARAWPKSGVVGVHTACIAADSGFFLATAFSKEPDGTQAADFIADLAAAMEVLNANMDTTPRALAERLIKIVDAGCRLGHAGTRPGWEHPSRWARIAAIAEALFPEDFRFDPKTAGEAWADRSWQTANSLAALSILQGSADHGRARCAKALKWLSSVGQLRLFQAACHDAIDLLEACRAARPPCAPNLLPLYGFISVQCDSWRGRPRARAGRLFIAQVFATVLARLLCAAVDIVAQPAFASCAEALHKHIFDFIETARSNLLLDQMWVPTRRFADPVHAAAALALERTMLALPPRTSSHDPADTERRLVSQLPMVFWIDPRASARAQADFAARLADVARLEELFENADAGLVGAGQRPDLAAIQQALSAAEVFVIFAIPRETLHPARRLIVFAITSSMIQTTAVDLEVLEPWVARGDGFVGALTLNDAEPMESSPLGDLVAITRIAIQDRSDDTARQRLAALYAVLIEPLKPLGIVPQAGQHWFICPSGPLHALPFAALVDPQGRHLGELIRLSCVPSASVFHKLRAAWAPGISFAGFANPSLDRANWKDLPKAEAETEAASTLLALAEPKVHLGPGATLAAWHQDAPGAEIIHVATHGDFPEANVLDLHAVLLTPEAGDDGRLTAERMLQSGLARTRIVTLSVCNGGLVRFGPGDELHGLIPACLAAGADNVLTTLWSVGDSMTALWMRAFYRRLAQLGPASAALAATSGMIANGAAMRDWAPFVLIGAGVETGLSAQ